MSKTLVYLCYFTIYSLILLVIGKASFKDSNSVKKFFVGNRSLGPVSLFFTFVGTWISAATILGFTGNVYEHGVVTIFNSVVPWFLGTIMLLVISKRLYAWDVITIPELIGKRYEARGLQIMAGLVMSVCYVFYIVIQIKGFGIASASLLGIDYKLAIFLIYLFILYSTFDGFHTVAKTDAFNLIMLTISVAVIYFILTGRMAQSETVMTLEEVWGNGAQHSVWIYVTMFFGWGLGLACNPQYMIRIISARDAKTAKKVLVIALVFLVIMYFCLTSIGLDMRGLFPGLGTYSTSDDVLVYTINHQIYSVFSGFVLISIIGAAVSTANSQLLMIGTSISYDVIGQLSRKNLSERRILMLSRLSIFIGGTIALFLALDPPRDTLSYGSNIWGIFAALFFPLIYGGLYFKRGTKAGAYASWIGALTATAVFYNIPMEIHPAFPSVMVSVVIYVVVSLLSQKEVPAHA